MFSGFTNNKSDKAKSSTLNNHLAEIASHVESTARTITVGASGKDFTTIQAALQSIKKHINATITINVDAGTYPETVSIVDFYGNGSIYMNGSSALADTYMVNNIIVSSCTCAVYIFGFKCTSSSQDAVRVTGALNVFMQYIKTDVSATALNGFFIMNSLATVINCQVSNRSVALYANQLSRVASRDWTAGSGNTTGIMSLFASTVGKDGTQPQGTTAESASSGGIIR